MADPFQEETLLLSSYSDEPECNLLDFDLSYDDNLDFGSTENTDVSKENQSYILGTLIVRVAAARDLRAIHSGGLGQLFTSPTDSRKSKTLVSTRRKLLLDKGSSNPYAIIKFGTQTQQTTVVTDTINPQWPREEQFYFDVSLPVWNMVHSTKHKNALWQQQVPQLHISIHHTENCKDTFQKCKKDTSSSLSSSSNDSYPSKPNKDTFLGSVSINVTDIILGKKQNIDEWTTLYDQQERIESDTSSIGQVRVICEYEVTDAPPRPGDLCRFTSLVHPRDIYPIPASTLFRVDHVVENDIYISYQTHPEKWLSTCKVHRFMILCEHRHQTAVERYQDEILAVAEKLVYSPMVTVLNDTVTRVPEDGVLSLGIEGVTKGIGLLGRWYQNGITTAVEDVIHVTNWDGRFNPRENSMETNHFGEEVDDEQEEEDPNVDLSYEEEDNEESGQKMPNCPITGVPMKHPVVAADGHTYEKSAITRWLKNNDSSPLTGTVMPHKNLVPNYLLISSFQSKNT